MGRLRAQGSKFRPPIPTQAGRQGRSRARRAHGGGMSARCQRICSRGTATPARCRGVRVHVGVAGVVGWSYPGARITTTTDGCRRV
jgi:hypothetical protein